MPKLRLDQFISVFLVSLIVLVTPVSGSNVVEDVNLPKPSDLPEFIDVAPVPVLSELVSQEDFLASISAQAVYVADNESAAVLLQENSDQLRAPASTTKLMTALVARQLYNLDDEFVVKEEAFTQGNVMGLQIGERISVQDLLHGLLMNSGNDAAFVLANNSPLGYTGFIAQMNQKATELHLDSSTFENPSGLDQDQHQMTARDLAIISREVMKDDFLRSIVGTQSKVITTASGQKHNLQSTHHLLGEVEGVVGVKTGTTYMAGETLVTQVERDGHTVVIVVMGSQDRYGDTLKIIEWVFGNYEWVSSI